MVVLQLQDLMSWLPRLKRKVKLPPHAGYLRKKTRSFHSTDDIAATGVVTLRPGKQGRQFGIILHVAFLLDKSFGNATLISLDKSLSD